MSIAEIHGKISDTGTNLSDRMEDLLTSDVFGNMRYLPVEKALIPFLHTARSFHGSILDIPNRVCRIRYSFWPWLKSLGRIPCEPDVVIGLQTEGYSVHLILVEAKYYSGLSSEENEHPEPNNQLARELDNLDVVSCMTLGWQPQLNIVSRSLLFVTQDMGMPRELLAESLGEYGRKRDKDGDIFWTSWRFLPSILERRLKEETSPEDIAVLQDMLNLLVKKQLIMFQGVDPVAELPDLPNFYHILPTGYEWPDIPEPLSIDYKYEVTK